MTVLIVVLAVLITLSGLAITIKPAWLGSFLQRNAQRLELHMLAVGIRLLLGTLLVVAAGASRFPVIVHWLGWIAIVAALILAVMGRQRFVRLMRWALGLLDSFGRVAGLIAAALGAFLLYAFL